MSIKLTLKELKDLLKIQNKKIKTKKRKRNKKRLSKLQQNNIRSSSEHMLSSGVTMMNSSNEQSELIRLQRQALEDKLKEDKENKIKKEAKEKEAKEQNVQDKSGGVVPYNRLSGNGGSNNLRNLRDDVNDLKYDMDYMYNWVKRDRVDDRVEELDDDDNEDEEIDDDDNEDEEIDDDDNEDEEIKGAQVIMPIRNNPKIPTNLSNVEIIQDNDEEEQENFDDEVDNDYVAKQKAVKDQLESTLKANEQPAAYFEEDQPEGFFDLAAIQPKAEIAKEKVAEEKVAEEKVAEEKVAEEKVTKKSVTKKTVAEEPVAEKPVVLKSNSSAITIIRYIEAYKKGKPYLDETLRKMSRGKLYGIALGIKLAAEEADKKNKNKKETTV